MSPKRSGRSKAEDRPAPPKPKSTDEAVEIPIVDGEADPAGSADALGGAAPSANQDGDAAMDRDEARTADEVTEGRTSSAAPVTGEGETAPEENLDVAVDADLILTLAEREQELAATRAEADRLLRQLAERDNQLRRLQRDRLREQDRDRARMVERLLPLVDDFQRAMEQLSDEDAAEAEAGSFGEGLRLIAQRLDEILERLGVEAIEALGEKFDPKVHEAMLTLPNTDAAKGVVVQELQKGYRLGDEVIRPSKVAVAG